MNIKVIGCSTSWTNRPTSSYCINDTILVDCGEGTLKQYKKLNINFYNIKNIFITHLHSDHSFTIANYVYHYLKFKNDLNKNKFSIYGPIGLKKHICQIIDTFMFGLDSSIVEKHINIVEISNFAKPIEIDNITITPYKLKHGALINIAYIFNDGKSSVGFSGDCTNSQNLEKFIYGANSIFLECCSQTTTKDHLGYDVYFPLSQKHPSKKFYAIHCNDEIYCNNKKLKIAVAKNGKTYKL